jgi:hypothetical protein
MTERLLQYIWQFQYFNGKQLTTATGELLQVLHPGQHNTNQGPDFLEARIKIGNTLWVGNIELHVNASGWAKHGHQHDINYNNVVLHVVWHLDTIDRSGLPLLVLSGRVPGLLLQQYNTWLHQPVLIPCSHQITGIKELVWIAWKERLVAGRLERKAIYVLKVLETCRGNWEEACWQLLARNFGAKINGEAFEQIARSLPLNLLAKHKNQLITLEALLLGQAGLLKGPFGEEYPNLLKREYAFHQRKYRFKKESQAVVQFLRMRPASFPSVRLAQLAAMLYQSHHLFSTIKEITLAAELNTWLNITASAYWNTHYKPDEPSLFSAKRLGTEMVRNIIINTVAPVLFSYGQYNKEPAYKEKALNLLLQTAPEKNKIIRNWQQLGIISTHAYDTQSFIELTTQYCQFKKCLDCAVGNAVLKTLTKT